LNDEQKNAYSANWIVKLAKKSYISGVNEKLLYLTRDEVTPLLALGLLQKLIKHNAAALFIIRSVR
tara:strand:+ start:545 stop:742 length:198 start_codon:yes stop_codon:yes gene_type:complete